MTSGAPAGGRAPVEPPVELFELLPVEVPVEAPLLEASFDVEPLEEALLLVELAAEVEAELCEPIVPLALLPGLVPPPVLLPAMPDVALDELPAEPLEQPATARNAVTTTPELRTWASPCNPTGGAGGIQGPPSRG